MSNFYNSLSLDDSKLKDASTSVEDFSNIYRITSAPSSSGSSSVTVLNIIRRNNDCFNRHNNTPENEDSNSSSATSSTKSLKVMKFGYNHHELNLDLADFGDSDGAETSLNTGRKNTSYAEPIPCKHEEEANQSSMNRISRKPRCKTNIFKALKSFEKNNSFTSNKRTENQDSRYVLDEVNQSTKSPTDHKVNQFFDKKYKKHAFTHTNLQNLSSVKEKSKIDSGFKIGRSLDKSRTTTRIDKTTFSDTKKLDFTVPEKVSPRINLSSLNWESKRKPCSSPSLKVFDSILNAQDKFRLKVRKAKTKMEYLSRNCRFLHLTEPEIKKPLLILDFDSLLIPFALPCEDLSKHKLEISRLIINMYSHFNIAIWSATSMKILVSRLKYLGIFDKDKVTKIIFCLDCTSTITVCIVDLGKTIVKSPEIIWNLYPQFNKKNTIMINEDLKKFIFKQYGVPVGTQKNQKLIKYFELVTISNFLANLVISTRSFSNLNIQSWKKPWN